MSLKQPFKIKDLFYGYHCYDYAGTLKTNSLSTVVHVRTFPSKGEDYHSWKSSCLCGIYYWKGSEVIDTEAHYTEVTCKRCKTILKKYITSPDWEV